MTGNSYLGWTADIFQYRLGTLILVSIVSSIMGSFMETMVNTDRRDRGHSRGDG